MKKKPAKILIHKGNIDKNTEGELTTLGINSKSYPPYPRTKTAYYNILQDQINSSHNRGYYAGRQEAINQERDSLFNRTVDALIKVSIALAERKH